MLEGRRRRVVLGYDDGIGRINRIQITEWRQDSFNPEDSLSYLLSFLCAKPPLSELDIHPFQNPSNNTPGSWREGATEANVGRPVIEVAFLAIAARIASADYSMRRPGAHDPSPTPN